MIRNIKFVSVLLFLAAPVFAVAPDAGPMIGHVTDNSARLWMQFPIAGEVTINTFDVSRSVPVAGIRVGLEGPSPFVCDVPISGLQPNHTYRVEVKFDGEAVKLPGPEVAIHTTPAPGDETAFSVAFGGGLHIAPLTSATASATAAPQPHKIPIFGTITSLKPRAFFFLGGTGELPTKLEDFPTTHRAAYRYIADFHSAIRREPDLQDLFRGTACYGIFAERDFGPVTPPRSPTPATAATSPADTSYPFAQESLVAFQRFWPNPDWGTPADPGCFCTFGIGDIDYFLLDARTFRTAPDAAEPHMLGTAQLAWLEKNLAASKASFKVLAAPCPLWGDDPQKPAADSWNRFPAEQQGFLKWLGDNRIDGIIALAGGQPAGQLTKLDPAAGGVAYPLFSLESSALLAAANALAVEAAPDPRRVGQLAGPESFGTLDFGGEHEHRFVTLRIRDGTGKTRVEQTLLAVNLRR